MAYSNRRFNQKKKKIWRNPKLTLPILALVLILAFLFVRSSNKYIQTSGSYNSGSKNSTAQNNSVEPFNKSLYSVNDPSSIWVVVNKGRVLPSTYVPGDLVVPAIPLRLSSGVQEMHLRKEAASALEAMSAAANSQNAHLMLASGYRSYSTQVSVYGSEVKNYGLAQADRESARPGHSEHQSGLAADLEPASRSCEVQDCFAQTAEGKWLATNSYKYGYVIRYQQANENITGYKYEPWHVRYVGLELAKQIYQNNQALEQFFALPIFTSYPANSYQLKEGS
jgi:D-alanyl-D-alanine carboxypeptidase